MKLCGLPRQSLDWARVSVKITGEKIAMTKNLTLKIKEECMNLFEEFQSFKKKAEGAAESQRLFLREGSSGFQQPAALNKPREELDRDQRIAKDLFGELFT